MNTIIVDDDFSSREIIKEFLQFRPEIEIVSACTDAFEAMDALKNEAIDLILLDINMPGMTGIEFIEQLKNPPLVILVTGNKDLALEGYKHEVLDCLIKPVRMNRFIESVDRAINIYKSEHVDKPDWNFLFVKHHEVLTKVFYDDIEHIEANSDYIAIYTPQQKYLALSTMHAVEKKLPSSKFLRIHRSHIINVEKLESIEDRTAHLCGKMIPIGKSYKPRLYQKINLI